MTAGNVSENAVLCHFGHKKIEEFFYLYYLLIGVRR